MGIMDFIHGIIDARHQRQLARDESRAKVKHANAETWRIYKETRLKEREFEVNAFFRHREQVVKEQLINHWMRHDQEISYAGAAGRYHRAAGQTIVTPADIPALPTSVPPFRAIMGYIKGENIVLGVNVQGVVQGTVSDWLSTLWVGMPRTGKTYGLNFVIGQLIILRAQFLILDPHAQMMELSTLLPYVHRVDRCIEMAETIELELEARIDRFEANNSTCLDPHYMLIVDELPAIADKEDQLEAQKVKFRSLIDVIRRIVCEGPKYHMYCAAVGQSVPHTVIPTIARDNMSSRYVFNCMPRVASMAGLDNTSINTMLPSLDNQVGKCIISPARMKPFLGAIPKTDISDLQYAIESTGYTVNGAASRPKGPIVDANPAPSYPPQYTLRLAQPTGNTGRLSGDLQRVYSACQQLESNDQPISARAIAAMTGMGKDKANALINQLVTMRLVSRQTDR